MSHPSHRCLRSTVLAAACWLLVAPVGIVALCSAPAAANPITAPSLPTPLATSIQSSAGTWATLPMGRLNEPLNTFWQLFFRPTGATTWSNKVGATATATNGGLVLAAAPGQPLIAAVRPADLLHFSPLIATDNGGASWTNGLLSQGLASSPNSLSTTSTGQTLALVNRGLAAHVLVDSGSLSRWRTLTAARRLASVSGGGSCGLRSLSAVASLSGDAIVGANCSRPGAVGIFVQDAGSWRLDAPTLPRALDHDTVQVLSLEGTASGVTALLGLTGQSGTALVAAWSTNRNSWNISRALAVGSGERLASIGPAVENGLFVLVKSTSGSARLSVIDGPGSDWQHMPPPPGNTATVAFDSATTTAATTAIDALVVHADTMTVWSLNAGSESWTPGQVVHVDIKFGSSS
jgi:hypothetical protein